MPEFSVIIPVYNGALLLREALDSVFHQNISDFEIIVVDDGSTDNSLEIARSYEGNVRILEQPNQGPGTARNLGALHARGRYLTFLDNDDVWFPWSLQTFQSAAQRVGNPPVMLGTAVRFDVRDELLKCVPNNLRFEEHSDFLKASQQAFFFGSNCCIRRDVFIDAGGFSADAKVFEDQDFGLRLGTVHPFVAISEPPTLGYRRTEGSLTNQLDQAVKGINILIGRECVGMYPGGASRKWERRNYISFSVRSLSIALLKQRRVREAWLLYKRTVLWQLRLGRIRYVAAFPVLWSMARFR